VLYVTVHAYSDLSARAAQELAVGAPESVEARKLNAESLELQGKWDDAAKQYEEVLKKTPDARGIHFRSGTAAAIETRRSEDEIARAKKEFAEELAIESAECGGGIHIGRDGAAGFGLDGGDRAVFECGET